MAEAARAEPSVDRAVWTSWRCESCEVFGSDPGQDPVCFVCGDPPRIRAVEYRPVTAEAWRNRGY